MTIAVGNQQPIAEGDFYSVDTDTTLGVLAEDGVISNDSDYENSILSALIQEFTSNGSISISADGAFSYTPNSGFNGIDTFTYTATDGSLESDIATVTLFVGNQAPVALPEQYQTEFLTLLSVDTPVGVLANDTDLERAILVATLIEGPQNGTLVLETDGAFTYQPNIGFDGIDSFTYVASDGIENSNPVSVSIEVATEETDELLHLSFDDGANPATDSSGKGNVGVFVGEPNYDEDVADNLSLIHI